MTDDDELLAVTSEHEFWNRAIKELNLIERFRALSPEKRNEFKKMAKVYIDHVRSGTNIDYSSRLNQLNQKWNASL